MKLNKAEGGKDLPAGCDNSKLRCDIVRMAHHGQDGVDHSFYNVVQPKICLYMAPDAGIRCSTKFSARLRRLSSLLNNGIENGRKR